MATEAAFKQFEKKISDLQESDQNGESGFAREFQALRQASFKYKGNSTYSTKAGESPVNRVKNRFKDILPFDYSRVTLPSNGDNSSDYINANFIKGVDGEQVYIASQGPLPHTVNDFWRMLWTYKAKVVVMLCREEENGKKKCQRYWCESDEESLNFGGILVKTERCIGVGNDFVMRTLVAQFQEEKLMITQFHYTAWPDHGVPLNALSLINLIKLVREYQPEDSPPIVLHCSAGCGRTGTICALDYTRSLLKETKYKELVPYRIVESLRKQRHAMVQTKGQYEFLCRAMLALFREKLDLPIDEEHDDHLYENVSPITTNSDSDSDFTPSSPVFFETPSRQRGSKKERLPPAAKLELKSTAGVAQGAYSGPNQKRSSQVAKQLPPSDNYVNVAFDLVDISDDKPPPPKSPVAAKPSNTNVPRAVFDGRSAKLPVSRKASAPEYVAEKSQSFFDDSSSEYVIVPPRAETTKTSRSLPTRDRYENVQPDTQSRPTTASNRPPPISCKPTAVNSYENVEAPSQKSPKQALTSPSAHERATKPATPAKYQKHKEFSRSMSTSTDVDGRGPARVQQPFATCGPSVGAKYADQMKAVNGLQRARVLPSQESELQDAEKAFVKDNDLNNGLYAAVNKRNKSARGAVNENTYKGGDSVDGERAPAVPKKSAELLSAEESHESNDSKSKTLSLTKKIPFLSKRPEVKGITLEHIGYGKRVPKPKGPRSPPKCWTVKS